MNRGRSDRQGPGQRHFVFIGLQVNFGDHQARPEATVVVIGREMLARSFSTSRGGEMSYQRLLALATLCAVGAFLTIVLRLAHPHHRQVALVIYGIGWIPFILSIRKLWLTFDGQSWRILQ
jgi:hypothetical protein